MFLFKLLFYVLIHDHFSLLCWTYYLLCHCKGEFVLSLTSCTNKASDNLPSLKPEIENVHQSEKSSGLGILMEPLICLSPVWPETGAVRWTCCSLSELASAGLGRMEDVKHSVVSSLLSSCDLQLNNICSHFRLKDTFWKIWEHKLKM